MDDIAVRNPGSTTMFVAGYMIPAGETRLLPAHLVPAHLRDAPPEPEPAPVVDLLVELLAGTVKDVAAALPGLDVDQLTELEALEALREAPRKGVLAAIAEELLKRAAAPPVNPLAQLLAGTVDAVTEALPSLDGEQLTELEALEALREAPRKGVLAAIAEELLKRAAAPDDPAAGGD